METKLVLKKYKFSGDDTDSFIIGHDEVNAVYEKGMTPDIGLSLSTSDKPVVGVVLGEQNGFYAISAHYVNALFEKDIVLRFISFQDVEKQLENVSGVLVPGGAYDSPSDWYVETVATDITQRTIANMKVTEYATTNQLPILGICAGMQIISGVLGYEHGVRFYHNLEEQKGCTEKHRNYATHEVVVDKKSKLYQILGKEQLVVNSNHKEAVVLETVSVDAPIKVTATSGEAVVEAVEIKDYPTFGIGVQWHPERMRDENSTNLFGAFVRAVAEYKKGS